MKVLDAYAVLTKLLAVVVMMPRDSMSYLVVVGWVAVVYCGGEKISLYVVVIGLLLSVCCLNNLSYNSFDFSNSATFLKALVSSVFRNLLIVVVFLNPPRCFGEIKENYRFT